MALSPAVVAAVAFVLLALMFGLGATMKDADIVAVSRRPKGIAVGLASQFVYMPFLAYIMAVSAGWSDGTSIQKLYALTLILQGCTPGGSTSNLYAYFSKGDLPLSVCMTVSSTIVAFGMMPALMVVYTKALGGDMEGSAFDIKELVKGLFLVLLPVGLGVLLRTKGDPALADRAVSIGSALGFVFIFGIMIYYLADADNREILLETEAAVYVNTILLGVVGATLGYLTAKFVAKEQPRQCRTIAFETGIQNGPLSIGIANAAFLFQRQSAYAWQECAQLCVAGVKYGCSGEDKGAMYGYTTCAADVAGSIRAAFVNATDTTWEGPVAWDENSPEATLGLDGTCEDITKLSNAASGGDFSADESAFYRNTAAKSCARIYCQNGYRADALDYNPLGLKPAAYTLKYGINLAKAGLFQSGGTKLLDGGKMEGVSIPYGVEQFQCPDYRATVVPLMYSFWICFTSPLMMLFFLFVLGARKEDMLWTEIPEHKWLWAMDFEKCLDLTLIDRVEMLMAKYAHHRAVAHKPTGTVMGPWEYWSFGDYYNAARGISRFLIDRGLTRAKSVAILSYNRREWFAADLGSIYAGAIPAGIYPTDTSTQIEYVLNHSEAEFVFVENQVQLEKIRSIRNKLLHVKEIIVFDEKDGVQLQDKGIVKKSAADKANEKAAEDEAAEGGGDDDGDVIEEESEWALGFESHVHYWSDIMMKYHTDDYQNKRWKQFGKFGQRKVNGRVQRFDETPEMSTDALAKLDTESATRRSTIKPEDVICMIYTSGTTGPPKAVMITHRNVGWSVFSIGDIMHVSPEDTVVSYLPLCHIAEKVCSLYGPLVFGMNVYFCAPDALRGTLVVSLRQVGPTVFFGVPRIWEKIQEKMLANSGKQAVYFCFCIPTGAWGKRKWKNLVAWARKKGLAGAYAFQQNEPMPKNWWYANELVFQNVKVALGLQRCRLMLSAAAPLSIETAEFFMCLNIIIYEAFGMSETAGPVTFNAPKTAQSRVNWRTNSCGKSITGVELKIADDGELLIRGACTCRGYFKNPEETVNLIDEEKWIHTGDIGTIDADGFLYITDRKKHLIITAGGENIAPAPIEGSLQNIPGIGYAIVVGDMQKFLVCVMTIEMQGAAYFAYKNYNWVGDKADWKGATAWLRDENKCKFKEDVWAQIEKINENLPRVSTIKKFYLFDRDFTDQGNMCELTPTLKVKHRVVKQKYQKVIKKIYGKDYKETNAKAVGGGASAGKMKINLGTWPGNRTILSMMIMTKDGKICIDDGTGCLPSVVLPDVSTNNISNSENIKFVWTQQFCKNTEKPPEFVAERTNEDMNSYGLAITSAIAALKTIVSDGDIGAIYPKMLSDFYKQDLKSAVLCSMRVVDDEKSVDVKGNNFRWIDAKSKPEYLTLQKLGNVSKTNSETPKPGIYISYMCTASTRAGLFMLTNQNNFSNIPHVLWQEGDFSAHGAKDNDLEFIRCIRAHVRGGGKIADMKHEGVEVPKFIASMEKLMAQLAIEEDETPMEKFVEHLYDFELINLDREHKVKFLVILHPTTLSNLTIPANLKKKHHLVPMAVYEPNHFYMWHRDVYTEMQVSVLGRNREASEMNWRVQHGKGEKGDKLKHKEEKEAIRKDARRWDCMKWHMKMVHWQSTEKSASYTDILSDEAQTAMSPLEQVNEVKSNWVDEYGDWEREVISICSEADGWSSLQVEVEKSKFTAKFRMKAGTGAASSMGGSQGGSVNFKSAGGASSQWGASSASSASGVGSSASMMSSASSMQSSASSVEDEDEEKSAVSSEGEKPVERKKSMSMKDKILFDEAQKKQRRVTELTNLSNNLVAQDGDSALTQSSVQDSKNMGNTRDGSQW